MSGLWFELVRCLFLLRVLSALLCIGSVCIVVHWLKCKLGKAGIQVHKMARGPWPRRAGSCPRSSTRPPSRGHGPRALGDLRASSSFHSFHFVVSFMNLRSKTCIVRERQPSHRGPAEIPGSQNERTRWFGNPASFKPVRVITIVASVQRRRAARLPGPCASFPVAVLVAPWQCRAAMLEHPASHVLGATL